MKIILTVLRIAKNYVKKLSVFPKKKFRAYTCRHVCPKNSTKGLSTKVL